MVSRWVADGTEKNFSVGTSHLCRARDATASDVYPRCDGHLCTRPSHGHARAFRRLSCALPSPALSAVALPARPRLETAGWRGFFQPITINHDFILVWARIVKPPAHHRARPPTARSAPDRHTRTVVFHRPRISAWIHTPPVDSASTARVIAVSTQAEGGFRVKKRVKKHGPARR